MDDHTILSELEKALQKMDEFDFVIARLREMRDILKDPKHSPQVKVTMLKLIMEKIFES